MKLNFKQMAAAFFMVFVILIGSGSVSYSNPSATIAFTGEMRGFIEPCPT